MTTHRTPTLVAAIIGACLALIASDLWTDAVEVRVAVRLWYKRSQARRDVNVAHTPVGAA